MLEQEMSFNDMSDLLLVDEDIKWVSDYLKNGSLSVYIHTATQE